MCENCRHEKLTKTDLLMRAYVAKQVGDMETVLTCYGAAKRAQEAYWRCCGKRAVA